MGWAGLGWANGLGELGRLDVRAMRECVHAMRACVRAMRACVRACGRAGGSRRAGGGVGVPHLG